MIFDPGIKVIPKPQGMGFVYGPDVFGPDAENRTLDSIRKSLRDPACSGPEVVYTIAMDVGKRQHRELLKELHLLFGIVTYAAGKLGEEPVRSQGHIHKRSPLNGWSTPEVYEIWEGKAIIYMQETARDDPGRCFAVEAGPGEIVVVPPGWAHATISADPNEPLTFGAWCDRAYGFLYDAVRAHNGLAWFPVVDDAAIRWLRNPRYNTSKLRVKRPGDYSSLGIEAGKPIYAQFEEEHTRFSFVPHPDRVKEKWEGFVP